MNSPETLEDFYKRSPYSEENFKADERLGDFAVFPRSYCPLTSPFSRRSFYKVALVLDPGRLYYADKWIDIDRPALQFSNPMIPYAWETDSDEQKGWFCLFTESFIHNKERLGSLSESPFFQSGGTPVFFLNDDQVKTISYIFEKMVSEMGTDYEYKHEAVRNYLHLLMHEAVKLQSPQENIFSQNAASRITSLFIELLERQFPVHFIKAPLELKSAKDFSNQLSVHVNSLNRSVKGITGKTTTQIISERIINEAITMLEHSDWNISQIAHSLGFSEPNNFTSFFKKYTQQTPSQLRNG
ncbi:AraC family transcriptional regulator [Flavobacterium rakeshii]|uniref:helix-turn-helix domain-containing protein n=1 Tax=Flavobacterium rakeshii TaxID=1038845 RepID=UPI002E7B1446|nr:AraC family transcriptional regulator [Flavobacterium rakeshii]MEE1900065.1 AraC family transcriptional regulator [Flavobacterium rakeshii]